MIIKNPLVSYPTVLFVDDENMLLSAMRRLFRRESYHVLFAESGQAALDILAETPVDVLVVDLQMPEMNGYELLKRVAQLYPHIVCLVLSAVTEKQKMEEVTRLEHVIKFIAKPVRPDVFKQVLHDSVRRCLPVSGLETSAEGPVFRSSKMRKKSISSQKTARPTHEKFVN